VKQKVTIATDYAAVVLPPNMSLHNYVGPPVPVSSPASAAAELPVPIAYPLGAPGHRLSRRVRHRKQAIALDGHDCGRMIPHIHAIPSLANALTITQTFFSSRRAMFFSSRVRIEGLAVAACDCTALPPTPMMSCSEPANLPAAMSLSSWKNTVVFGIIAADYVAAAIAIAASIGVDMLLFRAERAKARRPPSLDELFDLQWPDWSARLQKAFLSAALGTPQKWVAKSCAAAAAGVARLALTDGPFRMSVVTSGSKGVASLELGRDARRAATVDVDLDVPATEWPRDPSLDPAAWGEPL
jgi:hypothetical protein